ncbi:MAG: hypothetical protein A2149_01080 [Candidatus Schekmanbacteria bacterium RBG_16_38_11]|uniref:Uncharacterized protein n=1 Tax=Candidatus Schekmanbacteria bacterium RBG_16_38_11 TaxID=1817880 RepID=A0A1F7S2N7_9BACT|nr:MAG: hypothetical protein A2149_01080 [Candidatus Schekmanbacteria bacterium RBG_16_38_11]
MSRSQWQIAKDPEIIAKAEVLREKITKLSVDCKLGCAKAFKIAQEEGLTIREIGAILNILNIKIGSCQLGCFS